MCTATTGLIMQGAGAVSGAIGSYYSAATQKAGLMASGNIAQTNARLSELSARTALDAGQRSEQTSRLRVASLKGTQRAALAANGVALNEGSSAEILTGTDLIDELDAATIAANAARVAWGHRAETTKFQSQALMDRANAAGISPDMAAGTSLLASAGMVGRQWYASKRSGALG